jgi:hypothetical protein
LRTAEQPGGVRRHLALDAGRFRNIIPHHVDEKSPQRTARLDLGANPLTFENWLEEIEQSNQAPAPAGRVGICTG